ncbi:transcriptional regulator, IclR family [Ruegeria halocynthiae]|uniref:Transcriptional regulator, IclR family n=1 Tax=Ruegeria halocynthiae TaxID=985054 RepID=A0A1H2VIH8_9RHOB|nr:IclR family transcriptional regulator [Ruegeria halocynthiae]SDW68131.1 transcriptional regulator, IclR family [Ruegeria halocynthiae]
MESQKRPRGRPKSLFKESSAGTMQALDRALGVLTTVAQLERVVLSDLAREVDIPTATTHRILVTLQKHGFVSFDEERQEWMVGIEAYRTGASFLRRNNILEIGRPILRRLMLDSGETANLAVPDGPEVVFVGQVETQNPIRAFFPPGARTPMYASGTGKAILAALSEDSLNKVLGQTDLIAFTENTNLPHAGLQEDLAETRARGWSYDHEERYEGMSCIGAAIFNDRGEPCAGISVSGPTVRFDRERAPELGALVRNAAQEITHLSGGRSPGG